MDYKYVKYTLLGSSFLLLAALVINIVNEILAYQHTRNYTDLQYNTTHTSLRLLVAALIVIGALLTIVIMFSGAERHGLPGLAKLLAAMFLFKELQGFFSFLNLSIIYFSLLLDVFVIIAGVFAVLLLPTRTLRLPFLVLALSYVMYDGFTVFAALLNATTETQTLILLALVVIVVGFKVAALVWMNTSLLQYFSQNISHTSTEDAESLLYAKNPTQQPELTDRRREDQRF